MKQEIMAKTLPKFIKSYKWRIQEAQRMNSKQEKFEKNHAVRQNKHGTPTASSCWELTIKRKI